MMTCASPDHCARTTHMNRATILHDGTPHRGPVIRYYQGQWGPRVEIQPEEVQVVDHRGGRWADIEVHTGEAMGPISGDVGTCGS